MPLEWALSLRYLRATRSGGPISFVTWVAALGVALGVAALVVAMAVMNGYQVNLLQAMAGALPHVSVSPTLASRFKDPEAVRTFIADAVHPRAISRYGSFDTLLRKADSPASPLQAIQLRGIEPGIEAQEVGFLAFVEDGSEGWSKLAPAERMKRARDVMLALEMPIPDNKKSDADVTVSLLISKSLAGKLGVKIGDGISTLEFPKAGALTALLRPGRLVVRGLFETGILAFDEAIVLTSLNGLLHVAPEDQVDQSIGLRLADPLAAGRVADQLRDLVATRNVSMQVYSWLESNRGLFAVVQLQKVMLFLVLMLIVLIASFGMVSALVMLVTEKTREITILKALGARDRVVRRIFLLQGLLIGLGGLLAGLVLGVAICGFLAAVPLFEIPPGVYPGSDHIPVLLSVTDVLWVILGTIVIAIGATQFPAFKAMRLKIVDGLRRG